MLNRRGNISAWIIVTVSSREGANAVAVILDGEEEEGRVAGIAQYAEFAV